jgi:hypothetical protein
VRMLAVMGPPSLPVPVGILRDRARPCFETAVESQVAATQAKSGVGTLRELLHGNGTWTVE